jgi:hypothetical protein
MAEAVDVLKDRRVQPNVLAILRKMKPVRQAEASELMVSSNLYSHRFAEALLAGTRDEMLIAQRKVTTARTFSADHKARIASETDNLLQNSKISKNPTALRCSLSASIAVTSRSCYAMQRYLAISPILILIFPKNSRIW